MKYNIRLFNFELDWEWVNKELPIFQVEDTSGMVVMRGNESVGAMIMDNWTNNSVQAHFIVKDPMLLRTEFLAVCFDYVFNIKGRKVIYALVPADNEKAIKLNIHFGATEKCRFEEAYADGVDYIVMELKKENCKYLHKISEAA